MFKNILLLAVLAIATAQSSCSLATSPNLCEKQGKQCKWCGDDADVGFCAAFSVPCGINSSATSPTIYAMARVSSVSGGFGLYTVDPSVGEMVLLSSDNIRTELMGTTSGVAALHGDTYYYYGQSQSSTTSVEGKLGLGPPNVLVALSTIDASQTCSVDLSKSIANVGFIGAGVTVNFNSAGNNIMISGPTANGDRTSNSTLPHAMITADLTDCTITTSDMTYGNGGNLPIWHSSAMDKNGVLYTTLEADDTTTGVEIVDATGASSAKYMQFKGSASFWGVEINEEADGPVVVGIAQSTTTGLLSLTRVTGANSASPKWSEIDVKDPKTGKCSYNQLWGNDGSVNAFDATNGVMYVLACKAPAQLHGYTLVGVDVTNGNIVSAVELSGAVIDKYGAAAIAHMEISMN